MSRTRSASNIVASLASTSWREHLRSSRFWGLTLLGAGLLHFSHVFNLSAFQAPERLTTEMVGSTFWLMAFLFSGLLALPALRASLRRSAYILRFQSENASVLVLGNFLGVAAAAALGVLVLFGLSVLLGAFWGLEVQGPGVLGTYARAAGRSLLAALPVAGWCLLFGSLLPQVVTGFLFLGLLVVGQLHSSLFPADASLWLRGIGLVVPDLALIREPGSDPMLIGTYTVLKIALPLVLACAFLQHRFGYKT